MANADELKATLAVIKENLHLWNQNGYFTQTACGTAACFYDWTLLRHGYSAKNAWNSRIIARHILDLSRSEEDALAYYFTDSIEDLELRAKEIIAGEWAEPRDDNGMPW